MKRVLIFTSEFPPGPGGIGSHAYGLAMALIRKGFDVHIIADFRDFSNKYDLEWDKKQGINITRVKNRKPRAATYVERLTLLNKLVKELKPDVFIASGKFPLMFSPVIVSTNKIRKIGVIHGTEANLKGFEYKWMKSHLGKFDKLVCVSKFTAGLVTKHFGYKEKIKIIPNGFSPEKFMSYKGECEFKIKGKPSILTVGSITPRKGQHNVVRALPRISEKYPDAIYHVVGLKRDTDYLIKEIKKHRLDKKVILYGALSDEKLRCAYITSSVFMMLSESTSEGDVEGFGIAILEANYFGKPAIGSLGTGVEDAIRPGFNGELVNPHSPDAILSALSKVMNNYEVYSKNARAWAEKHTWDKVVDSYIDLF